LYYQQLKETWREAEQGLVGRRYLAQPMSSEQSLMLKIIALHVFACNTSAKKLFKFSGNAIKNPYNVKTKL